MHNHPVTEAQRDGQSRSLSGAALHILGMAFMLCDHLWATVVPGNSWLTCIGRLAFPIFAFLTVEGYFHTRSFKGYVRRLLCFALLSEIPFNLMTGGSIINPFRQNVLWTFLLGLGLIRFHHQVRTGGNRAQALFAGFLALILGFLLGTVTFCDYGGMGVLTVLAFYFLRGEGWLYRLGQLAALAYLNLELLGGLSYEVFLFGQPFLLRQQSFALLALVPIWLYRGRQGYHKPWFSRFCYLFYPAHMLLLSRMAQML